MAQGVVDTDETEAAATTLRFGNPNLRGLNMTNPRLITHVLAACIASALTSFAAHGDEGIDAPLSEVHLAAIAQSAVTDRGGFEWAYQGRTFAGRGRLSDVAPILGTSRVAYVVAMPGGLVVCTTEDRALARRHNPWRGALHVEISGTVQMSEESAVYLAEGCVVSADRR